MEAFVLAAAQYGYSLLFAVVLAESLGFPVPAAIGILAAGAAAAQGALVPWKTLVVAVGAMLIGDNVLFFLGRKTGWWLLGVLCRLSLNPESCVARSADAFYKRGRVLLIFAKFLPGINTMAPPLAGSMNLPVLQFWALDTTGLLLYITSYFTAGYLFSDLLATIVRGYSAVTTIVGWVLASAALLWLANRLRIWLRAGKLSPVKLLTPKAISEISDAAIYDVRSHGYHDAGTMRIRGSLRLDPNAIPFAVESLPRDREIVLYCTCIREATAIRVARVLAEHGVKAHVIKGGLSAWKKASLPVEPVPADEVIRLPRFS
jgi:membrane protein DedA with SNARE-associated domain/rhodanese-related sulfurtransferase